MQANAARQGPVTLWRQLSLRVLEALVRDLPDPGRLVSGLNWVGLFGAHREKHYARMTAAERQDRLRNAALAAHDLLERLPKVLAEQPTEACADLRQVRDYLQKSLEDEVLIAGEAVQPRKPKGTYCIGSATDPEATFRNHGERDGEPDITLGYNPQVAATQDGLITETQAHTGAMTDQQTIADLISEQQEHHGVCPPKMIYDTAAGYGKIRHAVEQASDGQTIISAPLPDYAGRTDRFGPYDFSLSEDGATLTCPQGKSTDVSYAFPSGDGRTFRFVAPQCWQGKPPRRLKNADLS